MSCTDEKNRKDTWAGKSNITKMPRSNLKRDNYNKPFKPVKNYFFFFFFFFSKTEKFLSKPILATKHWEKQLTKLDTNKDITTNKTQNI